MAQHGTGRRSFFWEELLVLWLLGLPGAPLVASAALGEAVQTVWLEVVHHRLQWARLHWHGEVRGSGALAVDEGLDLGAIDVDGK